MSSAVCTVELPVNLVDAIDKQVGEGRRVVFLAEVAEAELRRLRMREFLRNPEPAWKKEDHPELAEGSAAWVRGLRAENNRRLKQLETRRNAE